jgi:general transcription factor 3C polypeptide 3 (transcription factor C subunit 4)
MVKNEEEVAMDILEHVIWSGLFNNRRCEVAIRLAIIGEYLQVPFAVSTPYV